MLTMCFHSIIIQKFKESSDGSITKPLPAVTYQYKRAFPDVCVYNNKKIGIGFILNSVSLKQ